MCFLRGFPAVLIVLMCAQLHAQPRQLSLSNAILAALENNADIRVAEEEGVQATARAKDQRGLLLPDINGSARFVNQEINLLSFGIQGPNIPVTVGSFNIIDFRVHYAEPILDLSLIQRYRASRRAVDASQFETEAVKNRVSAMVAKLYFNVQRARSLTESVKAQIELDNSLLKLARDRQEVGVGTVLDVTRAQTRLATSQQRLLQAENDTRTAELQLLRAMGERPNARLELTDSLDARLPATASVDQAVMAAVQNRPEIKAEDKRVEAARISLSASKAEKFPVVNAFADYGDNGNRVALIPTHNVGVQMQIPLFDGGRRSARRVSSESQLRQAEVRARDARDEIELDVRIAVDNLSSVREQLRVAEQTLKLAQDELELARLRFEAQVTTQLDVINAQTQLADARSRRVNALATLKGAEVEYQRAIGVEIR